MKVAVAGAGPAGAIAALVLARGGAKVDLYERGAWPREKTCGDAISPLAIAQCRDLGIAIEGAVHLSTALITTPRERAFRGSWPRATPFGTTVTRYEFDAQLVDAAIAAGVSFWPKNAVDRLELREGGVQVHGASYDAAIVAEGATGKLSAQLGFTRYRSRLIGLRGYAALPRSLPEEYGIFYDRDLQPGYGWIFPLNNRCANVGILVDELALARSNGNARALFERWLQSSRFAMAYLGEKPRVGKISGGIIPSGRAQRAKGRVLLAGDAAGVADPFTAEGIYQAIYGGRLAGEALLAGDPGRAGQRYVGLTRSLDRNDRAARILRATFGTAIELCAVRANQSRRFGDELSTAVFFPKHNIVSFGLGVISAALSSLASQKTRSISHR